MIYKVIFSDEATSTFESIGQQIQAKWSEREVNEFRKKSYSIVEMISKHPLMFKALGNDPSVRKAFIHKNCSMFYFVGDNYIELLFFWDNRQDPIFI
ncbi:MAG: type II toxin-antitoxin system RelE/ParE family toxin [Mucilaginibacter sp.]